MYKPRLMDPRRSASVLALFAAIALFVGSSAVAGTGTSVALGAIGFGSIAVDDAGGHVFVSGPRANEVLVFGFGGSLLRTVPNVYGAGAMVVHGGFLYVAEVNTGTIEAIDLSTLTDSGPLATGLNLPTGLAFAGGKLWTAVNGQSGWAQLASVAPNGTVTVFSDTSYYEPDFGTSAGDPNTLYVAEDGLSPGAIFRLDVSTGSPVVSSSNTFTDQENIEQVAVSPDGSRVIPAAGYPYNFEELSAATLSADGMVYPALPYPSAVAVSPGSGGLLATGLDNGYSSPDISVFRLGAPQAIFTATTTNSSGTANVVPHGLALSADGSRLFAVTADDVSAAEFHLWTFGLNIKMNTTTSVSVAPSPSGFGQPATVTATTSPTDGGGSVAFYANNTPISGHKWRRSDLHDLVAPAWPESGQSCLQRRRSVPGVVRRDDDDGRPGHHDDDRFSGATREGEERNLHGGAERDVDGLRIARGRPHRRLLVRRQPALLWRDRRHRHGVLQRRDQDERLRPRAPEERLHGHLRRRLAIPGELGAGQRQRLTDGLPPTRSSSRCWKCAANPSRSRCSARSSLSGP
jgi:hypothetical protein